MKRLKSMTNIEYVQKYHPEYVDEDLRGGAIGCPSEYGLEKELANGTLCTHCTDCYNLPAKRKGKYIMKIINNG